MYKIGRPRKYPWEKWFGDGFAVLMRGVDYQCSQSTMAQTVRNNASARGLKVSIEDTGTDIILTVIGRREGEVQRTDKAPVTG